MGRISIFAGYSSQKGDAGHGPWDELPCPEKVRKPTHRMMLSFVIILQSCDKRASHLRNTSTSHVATIYGIHLAKLLQKIVVSQKNQPNTCCRQSACAPQAVGSRRQTAVQGRPPTCSVRRSHARRAHAPARARHRRQCARHVRPRVATLLCTRGTRASPCTWP